MSRKWIIRYVMAIILVAELYLLYHSPAVLLAGMSMIGRSDCSLRKTLALAKWKVRYLDSEARMRSFSRLIRRENSLQLWSTPRGDFWLPEGSIPLIFGVLAEQELEVYGSGALGVQSGDVVIDCGADIGTYTRAALEMGASLVIAVEPEVSKIPCLQRNFSREIASGRVKVYAKGVWNKDQFLPLYGGSIVWEHAAPPGVEVIQLTTIDNLMSELKLDRVDFIKMDIEGAEKQALEGARHTLVRFRPRLAISTEHFQAQAKEVYDTVKSIVPNYSYECGPCTYLDGRICPHVVFFH